MKAGSQGSGGTDRNTNEEKKIFGIKKYLASDLLCGHGEQGGDAEGDPGGDSVGV